ncbi:hypothetical protein PTKIN_Ptkin11bG0146400 [Pterospermum kingtungense]
MLSLPSSPSSRSSISRHKYDVFLSFRGEDTRKNFTDHLYTALNRSGIITFKDDTKLKAGEGIAPELFKAIEESWCFVIVFQKHMPPQVGAWMSLPRLLNRKTRGGIKFFQFSMMWIHMI